MAPSDLHDPRSPVVFHSHRDLPLIELYKWRCNDTWMMIAKWIGVSSYSDASLVQEFPGEPELTRHFH